MNTRADGLAFVTNPEWLNLDEVVKYLLPDGRLRRVIGEPIGDCESDARSSRFEYNKVPVEMVFSPKGCAYETLVFRSLYAMKTYGSNKLVPSPVQRIKRRYQNAATA